MSSKFRVGILGATGTVGQRFIQMRNSYTKACTWRILNAELLAAKGHFE